MTLCPTFYNKFIKNLVSHPHQGPRGFYYVISPVGPEEGQSPHLCTMALSLLRGHDEIGHNYKGAVPLEMKGREMTVLVKQLQEPKLWPSRKLPNTQQTSHPMISLCSEKTSLKVRETGAQQAGSWAGSPGSFEPGLMGGGMAKP